MVMNKVTQQSLTLVGNEAQNATFGGTNQGQANCVQTYGPGFVYGQGFQTYNLGEAMVMSGQIGKIAPALVKAQRNMSNATKDSKNPFFKSSYADLNSIREACTPALNAEDITVLQPMIQKDGQTFVRTLLLHSSGEYFGSDTPVITAKQNDPQALGSAISYARRYGLQALVSLGAEDNDAEGAMNRGISIPASSGVTSTEISGKKATFRKPAASVAPTKVEATPEGWE
jgi:hypothetical protein